MSAATEIHMRVFKAIGLSLLVHTAALAGWKTHGYTPPQLAAFEPIEVALIGDPAPPTAPSHRARPVLQPLARAADISTAEPTPVREELGDGAKSEEPLVEARSNVASLNNPKPPYPLAARRRGIEGRVLLSAHVSADGSCQHVQLKHSSGHSLLDDAALSAVRRWRFIPAQRGARAVDSWVDVPVSFRLES